MPMSRAEAITLLVLFAATVLLICYVAIEKPEPIGKTRGEPVSHSQVAS